MATSVSPISVLTSWPTDNIHLTASACNVPARFLSVEPFRRGRENPKAQYSRLSKPFLVFARAVSAGVQELSPLKDQFYGDRTGGVTDPYGHVWYLSTHKEDVPPDELPRRDRSPRRKAFSGYRSSAGPCWPERLSSRGWPGAGPFTFPRKRRSLHARAS